MVLLMDKPKGWTSFDVVGKTRSLTRKFGSKKVGHCGTLDPDATGLLILCVGKATKLVEQYTGMDKVYTGVLRLGESTPSQDAATEVDETAPWEHVTDEQLTFEANAMVGEIFQIPPMYSAIKVKGERLYKAARRGEVVERKERLVKVNSFIVARDESDRQNVLFKVDCSKGTYVRTLAHDLGKRLGSAAHLTALRRESIGAFKVKDAWTVENVFEACQDQLEEHLRRTQKSTQMEDAAGPGGDDGASEDKLAGRLPVADAEFSAVPGYETRVRTLVRAPDISSAPRFVTIGSSVTVHATGFVAQTDAKFWSTKDPGQTPFTYRAGVGAVITGWDQAVMGMRVGEVREAKIPAKEGYGEEGFPAWGIPPGGTLLFQIEVLSVDE